MCVYARVRARFSPQTGPDPARGARLAWALPTTGAAPLNSRPTTGPAPGPTSSPAPRLPHRQRRDGDTGGESDHHGNLIKLTANVHVQVLVM